MDPQRRETKTSIDEFLVENRGPRPIFRKLVGCKVTADPRFDVNSYGGMNSGSDAVVTPNPNFMNFGIASVNITDKIGSVRLPATRVERPTEISDWIRQGHNIEEAMTDRVSETRSKIAYILKIILKI